MLIVTLVISIILQSGSITKNSGEVVELSRIAVYQEKDVTANSLAYYKGGQLKSIKVSNLRRINFKESVGKSKGVTKWLVILVEKNNAKHEVEMDIHEIRGVNSEGKELSISANSIDKITF